MQSISSKKIASPGGHYSPGMLANGFLFVSGQLPINAASEKITGSIQDQTIQVLRNVQAVVNAAGGTIQDIVKTTIYISNGDHWGAVNSIYAEFFGDHRPARAIVPVNELHFGFLIEMEAIAHIPKK